MIATGNTHYSNSALRTRPEQVDLGTKLHLEFVTNLMSGSFDGRLKSKKPESISRIAASHSLISGGKRSIPVQSKSEDVPRIEVEHPPISADETSMMIHSRRDYELASDDELLEFGKKHNGNKLLDKALQRRALNPATEVENAIELAKLINHRPSRVNVLCELLKRKVICNGYKNRVMAELNRL